MAALAPPEPIIKNFHHIECRDAVLAYDRTDPVLDAVGQAVTRWDGRTMKSHPVTDEDVPDETARVPLLIYVNPRAADWPRADFIVGNPPYIGVRRLKASIGDEYVDTLRKVYPDVPETSDYVMYWWQKAALAVASGVTRRFGLITTNSIVQSYSRRLLENHIGEGGKVKLAFAIADHPWVDAADGAAVRVAMTVACAVAKNVKSVRLGFAGAGENDPVTFREVPRIGSSLDAVSMHENIRPLESNVGMCFQGVVPAGDGFKLDDGELTALGFSADRLPAVVRRYIIGRDLVQHPETRYIIDLFGLSESEARSFYPQLFQRLLNRVYPERKENKRASYRDKWWIFAEPRPAMRRALAGLSRFIVTPYTAKHRPFIFVNGETLPDAMAYAVASDDAAVLGVLSSRAHAVWALATGGTLEDRPRYNSHATFFPFPFPSTTEVQQTRIRDIAETLDAHRKRQQARHPKLTLTEIYNTLDKLRAGTPLNAKEQLIHERGLVSVLSQLHDDLDAAVADAYGWSDLATAQNDAHQGSIRDFKTGAVTQIDSTPEGFKKAVADFEERLDAETLTRLVALNATRTAEERAGHIRYLRPSFQKPTSAATQTTLATDEGEAAPTTAKSVGKLPWPKTLAEQAQAVRAALTIFGGATDAPTLAKTFKSAKTDRIEEILETLASLGQARALSESRYVAV